MECVAMTTRDKYHANKLVIKFNSVELKRFKELLKRIAADKKKCDSIDTFMIKAIRQALHSPRQDAYKKVSIARAQQTNKQTQIPEYKGLPILVNHDKNTGKCFDNTKFFFADCKHCKYKSKCKIGIEKIKADAAKNNKKDLFPTGQLSKELIV